MYNVLLAEKGVDAHGEHALPVSVPAVARGLARPAALGVHGLVDHGLGPAAEHLPKVDGVIPEARHLRGGAYRRPTALLTLVIAFLLNPFWLDFRFKVIAVSLVACSPRLHQHFRHGPRLSVGMLKPVPIGYKLAYAPIA